MSFDLIFQNGVRLHQEGRLDEAEAVYRSLLEISPDNADILHLLGMIAMNKRAFDSALDILYKAVRLSPETTAYRFTLAQTLQESGHPKEAMEHYRILLEKDDSFPEIHHNIGIIHRFAGEIEEAEASFWRAVGKKPDFSPSYINLALIERDKGNMDDALRLLEKAVESNSDEAEAYAQLGVTHRMGGRFEKALGFFQKALSLNPDNPVYWNGAGITYECLGDLDSAFDAYDNAVRLDPHDADGYNNRANIYAKKGKHWEAEADYKKAVKVDPEYAAAYNNLGALLYRHDRAEEALECYRKAFLINPKQAETCSNLAMAVKDAGDPAEAAGLYFTALANNPSLTEIHHYIAQSLYELYVHKNDKDTAKMLAQKWEEFFPGNPVAHHVRTAFEGGRPEQAEAAYVRELFDSFAETFESSLEKINYRVPVLLKREMEGRPSYLRILDAGCGTGLNAAALKPYARTLTGVDISGKMIARAQEKGLYDELEVRDLVSFMKDRPGSYDLAVFADVACYFGALQELMRATAAVLAPDGAIFMTIEKLEETAPQDYALQPSGRFAHKESFVRNVLEQADFKNIRIETETLRNEGESSVAGLLVLAGKDGGKKLPEKTNRNLDNDGKND